MNRRIETQSGEAAENMESSTRGNDDNWLRDFIAGALDDAQPGDSATGTATPMPPSWADLIDGPAPGKAIGPYQITRKLGQGGMGVVFQAFDSALRRIVAVKFLSPRLAVSSLARLRFTREAQAAAAINHPNVVAIHAIGDHEGLPYLVMEYVAGITLADRLKQEGILGIKSILRIGIQIATGLAAAHDQGLIHRDVKPANILLESGIDRVKISDFGLACITAEPWRLTASGVLLGTPLYMSPEQAGGAAMDHRSDLFSLGSVLYVMCTGEPPFPGSNVKVILDGVRDREPRPIRDLNPDILPTLERHIRRLMAKSPADRFASAKEVVRTLVDYLAEIQGRKSDHSLDDPLPELPEAAAATNGSRPRKFEIVDDWDGLTLPSPAGAAAQSYRFARLAWPVARSVFKIIVMMTAIVCTVFAARDVLPWMRLKDWADLFFPEAQTDRAPLIPVTLLLWCAILAILVWIIARLLAALRAHGAAKRSKR
jgi:serine/threonine protein kinase